MTTPTICRNCTGFSAMAGSFAVGDDSITIAKSFRQAIADFRHSTTTGTNFRKAGQALNDISREASVDNWDGYGAKAVSSLARFEAKRFMELLPTSIPMPEISAVPNGDIALEWLGSKRYMFSISLSGQDKITYAGIFGGNEIHGTEFLGDSIPRIIIESILRAAI